MRQRTTVSTGALPELGDRSCQASAFLVPGGDVRLGLVRGGLLVLERALEVTEVPGRLGDELGHVGVGPIWVLFVRHIYSDRQRVWNC